MKKYISGRLRDSGMISRISKSSMQIKIACLAILFMFLFCTGFAPLHKINELKKLTGADILFLERYDSTYDHPEIQPLVREKAYKSALLTLSGQDSIQLIINLHDSVACLSIRGVIIHESSMKHIRIDPFLTKLHNREYVWLFSRPVQINSQYATVVKEPIVVRQAPKDELEASLNAYQPDTLIQNPAFLQLRLDHDINLIIEQDSNPRLHDKWVKSVFSMKIWTGKTISAVGHFLSFKKQSYLPVIHIHMPVDDVRTIYRALPDNGYTVIYY